MPHNPFVRLFFLAVCACLFAMPGRADDALLAHDRAMAALAKAKGAVAAFDKSYSRNVRLMLQGAEGPIDGKALALAKRREQLKGGAVFEWTPILAKPLAKDGSGYTSGWWALKGKTATGRARNQYGHYAAVWTKESDGQWRVVLDVVYRGRKPKKS